MAAKGRPPLPSPGARSLGQVGSGTSRPQAGNTWALGSKAKDRRQTHGATPYRGGLEETSRARRRAAVQPARASWRMGLG